MEREGEGRSTADTARERRQHEERAAGPAAQFTHHETASAQGGHTTPAATTQRIRSKQTLIHPSRGTKLPAIPPSMGHGAQLSAVTRGASHPQENRLGVRSISPPSHGHGRRQQPPHATASMHYKRSIHIHCNVHLVCVWLCVPAETQSKDVEKREQSMWRDAQKCTAGTHNGNNNNNKKTAQTHDCTAAQAAAIHTIFIENKKTSPSSYVNPTTQNNYK
ncbi:hypothetical protein TCDM_13440 [Trypanosoma cruzi Dm28c]|uniref:Uncharacterized protein n=1 Tax=Trypanosoma cruzi Dm28c TaxID=1416333 RepID=V5ASR8_TRYCR|nr:hypothetical protein TCDM_13440 [Trypanosoma cruzi Dm28c]